MKLTFCESQRQFAPQFLAVVVVVHVGTLIVAPLLFSWEALLFAIGAAFVFGHSLGIFFHSLLSHNHFRCTKWLEYLGSTLAALTWRGPMAAPIRYVAMHRIHHIYSDTEKDPHSPIHGKGHALLTWFWRIPRVFLDETAYSRLAGAVAKDPVYRFLDRHVHLVQLLWGAGCFSLGVLLGDTHHRWWYGGLQFLVYGVFVKTFFVIYAANAVDLFNHWVGYRSFETQDNSTNNPYLAFLHGGGGITWHNNHHMYPGYFGVKSHWWEFDLYYLIIRGLQHIGLVSHIAMFKPKDCPVLADEH